ncbi:MAG: hypothetical protein KI790_11820 [Cyclobacteriaceae bacterium]|nr:hypothetical protein [Cyclobacteriaceae bacterium HetDA_MAG_MS6]
MRNGLILLVGIFFLAGCKLADLRTDAINGQSPNRDEKAVDLLKKTIAAQNLEMLKKAESYTMESRDNWRGMMAMMNPFPKDDKRLEFRFRPMSFDGQMQYLETKKKDNIYGIQSLNYYKIEDGEEAVFKDSKKMEFAIAAVQYLFELSLRMIDAPILKYAGTKEVEGVAYDLVFATWESITPNKTYDQYLLFIHPETSYLAFASYTIRSMYMPAPKSMYGSIRYEDMITSEDGIKYASTLYVQINKLKSKKKWAHKMNFKDLKLNQFDQQLLYPNDEIEFLGDTKSVSDK